MYCYYCAKEIDEGKAAKNLAKRLSKQTLNVEQATGDLNMAFVCPRCGHLIKGHASKNDIKSLSQAAHAQIQRSRNDFASGMGLSIIGIIILALAALFFLLSIKPTNNYQLSTTCAEFYVSIVLGAISVILLVLGIIRAVKGVKGKHKYVDLLRDINNNTFAQ